MERLKDLAVLLAANELSDHLLVELRVLFDVERHLAGVEWGRQEAVFLQEAHASRRLHVELLRPTLVQL